MTKKFTVTFFAIHDDAEKLLYKATMAGIARGDIPPHADEMGIFKMARLFLPYSSAILESFVRISAIRESLIRLEAGKPIPKMQAVAVANGLNARKEFGLGYLFGRGEIQALWKSEWIIKEVQQ